MRAFNSESRVCHRHYRRLLVEQHLTGCLIYFQWCRWKGYLSESPQATGDGAKEQESTVRPIQECQRGFFDEVLL